MTYAKCLDIFAKTISMELKDIIRKIRKANNLTQEQMAEFQEFFENNGHEIIGSVRRMGLITFRIAMILTTVRLMYTNQYES